MRCARAASFRCWDAAASPSRRSRASIAPCGTSSASRWGSRYGGCSAAGAAKTIAGLCLGRLGGPDKIGDELLGYVERGGFGAVKMRVGIIDGDPRHSAARVRAAREALGPEIGLDVRRARDPVGGRGQALLPPRRGLQPRLVRGAGDGGRQGRPARGAAATDIPIASGESEFTRHDFRDLAVLGAVDIMQPDLAICGGITEAMRISAMASAFNLKLAPHLWAGAPAFAAGLRSRRRRRPGSSSNIRSAPTRCCTIWSRRIFRSKDGMIEVPERPGLGITVREDFSGQAYCHVMKRRHKEQERPYGFPPSVALGAPPIPFGREDGRKEGGASLE